MGSAEMRGHNSDGRVTIAIRSPFVAACPYPARWIEFRVARSASEAPRRRGESSTTSSIAATGGPECSTSPAMTTHVCGS